MTLLANHQILPSKRKNRKTDFSKSDFMNAIDSAWRDHEPFARWLVKRVRPKIIVDLGFDRAFSTIAFAHQNRGHVYGVDWFENGNYAAKSFALDSAFRNVSNAIKLQYAKNIHLIVGPFREVSKNWNRKIDILHIGWAYTYAQAKRHYDNWNQFLEEDGIILVHDVVAYPNETGKFFEELPLFKMIFPFGNGLGVASNNENLIEEIKKRPLHNLLCRPNSMISRPV